MFNLRKMLLIISILQVYLNSMSRNCIIISYNEDKIFSVNNSQIIELLIDLKLFLEFKDIKIIYSII